MDSRLILRHRLPPDQRAGSRGARSRPRPAPERGEGSPEGVSPSGGVWGIPQETSYPFSLEERGGCPCEPRGDAGGKAERGVGDAASKLAGERRPSPGSAEVDPGGTAGEPRGDGATRLALPAKKNPRGEGGSRPYRKPTPVGEDECPKASERDSAKELGKLGP